MDTQLKRMKKQPQSITNFPNLKLLKIPLKERTLQFTSSTGQLLKSNPARRPTRSCPMMSPIRNASRNVFQIL